MKKRKEKEFKIRTYLTGIIWLALACSMIISALLFAFLKHFLEMPENIPAIVWLLIFNTMIAGLITVLLNGKVLEPITKLSEAMKDVSQGDFDKQLETSSRIAEVAQSYNSFNVMTAVTHQHPAGKDQQSHDLRKSSKQHHNSKCNKNKTADQKHAPCTVSALFQKKSTFKFPQTVNQYKCAEHPWKQFDHDGRCHKKEHAQHENNHTA